MLNFLLFIVFIFSLFFRMNSKNKYSLKQIEKNNLPRQEKSFSQENTMAREDKFSSHKNEIQNIESNVKASILDNTIKEHFFDDKDIFEESKRIKPREDKVSKDNRFSYKKAFLYSELLSKPKALRK